MDATVELTKGFKIKVPTESEQQEAEAWVATRHPGVKDSTERSRLVLYRVQQLRMQHWLAKHTPNEQGGSHTV